MDAIPISAHKEHLLQQKNAEFCHGYVNSKGQRDGLERGSSRTGNNYRVETCEVR